MRGTRFLLGVACALAAFSGAAALTCYNSGVSYDGEAFRMETTIVRNCPVASTACVTRSYTEGFVAHDCSTGFENCSFTGVDKPGVDVIGEHTYSCCITDRCNNQELRLPEVVVVQARERPECNVWLPRDFDANEAVTSNTKAEDLKQGFTLVNDDQRSEFTFGVQPVTSTLWLTSRDTSSPNCFNVAGEIKTGFCGVRYNVLQDGSKAKNSFGEDDVLFQGKYFNSYCGGSRSEALALQDDFTLVNRGIDRDTCMRLMLESELRKDCESIKGKYNLYELVSQRRNLLPDCCLTYVEAKPDERMQCDCFDSVGIFTPECAAVCCCEQAVMNKVPEDRCASLDKFTSLTQELQTVLRRQCCFTRMMSQCRTGSHCNDLDAERGRVGSLSTMPLCCDYCEDYYDEICSYRGVGSDGEQGQWVRMKQTMLKGGLKDLCRSKLCRTRYPCTFARQSEASRGRDKFTHTFVLFALVIFLFCTHV